MIVTYYKFQHPAQMSTTIKVVTKIAQQLVCTAILLLFSIPTFADVQYSQSAKGSFDGDADQVIRLLQITANELNKGLPTMIDNDTRFDRVGTGPGRKITYVRTLVNYTASEMPARRLESLIGESIRNGVCSAPEMQVWLNDNVTIAYRYRDRNSNYIHQFVIRRSDCSR